MPTSPTTSRALALLLLLAAGAAVWFLWPRGVREEPAGTGPAPGGIAWTPLRAAEGGETPRFRRLPAAETGLAFANELRKENRYQYLTNGAGLAAGDYDGDGL